MNIPEEAVEAVAKELMVSNSDGSRENALAAWENNLDGVDEEEKNFWRSHAQIYLSLAAPIIEVLARRDERKRIERYLHEKYGEVGRNASRRAAYSVAKDLAINLLWEDAGFLKGGES